MNIRPATPNDVPALLEIERGAATAAHWTEAEYRGLLQPIENSHCTLLVAEEHGSAVGFLSAKCLGEQCEIENIVVRAEFQRLGTAHALLQRFLGQAKERGVREVLLEVRSSNRAARELYAKCNFSVTGNRRAYYHAPEEDAVLYKLDLSG